jgi:hypothetical protein
MGLSGIATSDDSGIRRHIIRAVVTIATGAFGKNAIASIFRQRQQLGNRGTQRKDAIGSRVGGDDRSRITAPIASRQCVLSQSAGSDCGYLSALCEEGG